MAKCKNKKKNAGGNAHFFQTWGEVSVSTILCKVRTLFLLALYSTVSDCARFYSFFSVCMCYLSLKSANGSCARTDSTPTKKCPPKEQFGRNITASVLYQVSTPATRHSQMSFCLNEFSKDIVLRQNTRYVTSYISMTLSYDVCKVC